MASIYELHILLTEVADHGFTATCLDFYLNASGSTRETALSGLEMLIHAHLEQCSTLGEPPMRPAPVGQWNRWYEAWSQRRRSRLGRPLSIEEPARLVRFEALEAAAA